MTAPKILQCRICNPITEHPRADISSHMKSKHGIICIPEEAIRSGAWRDAEGEFWCRSCGASVNNETRMAEDGSQVEVIYCPNGHFTEVLE